MQFEDFDNKVRQAADQHHPNYDEKAWAKMEKLLDRHIPVNKDRRRIIFFLFAFILLGGGVWLAISRPWEKPGPTLSTLIEKDSRQKTATVPAEGSKTTVLPADNNKPDQATQTVQNNIANDKTVVSTPTVQDEIAVKQDKQKRNNNSDLVDKSQVKPIVSRSSKISKGDELSIDVTDPARSTKKPGDNNAVVSSEPAKSKDQMIGKKDEISDKTKATTTPDIPNANVAKNDASQTKTSTTKKDDAPVLPKVTEEKKVAKKSARKKTNSFFFSLSAGPDVSSVGMDNPGKVKLVGGAGLGYTFNDRWTLRAGFYTGSKVYTADPSDYNPKIPPPNPQYLNQIDANCRIYEIPLSVSYNFSRSKKHSAFVSTGLSSYIMKKETYVYLYKYPGNPTVYPYTWELKDKNKHFFSVVTVSGGYQRKINKLLSVAAEPYIKLPLAGVGFGKIKLNSAGILVSAIISPFQK